MKNNDNKQNTGILYIVATPIGNMGDITIRAISTLKTADYVAAEDTRRTGRLLEHHNIKTRLISYHMHNEKIRSEEILEFLKTGFSVALVSDAGTPSISDPGHNLITSAIENNINVVPIPGVSAIITAISAAGLPMDEFYFAGFISRKKGKRIKFLIELSLVPVTLIFYESPKRLTKLMRDIMETMGNRYTVLAREMTKLHEEYLRGSLPELIEILNDRPVIKGECTLLVSGHSPPEISEEKIIEKLTHDLAHSTDRLSEITKKISKEFKYPKSRIYEIALKIRDES